jgi:hypothetical protein
MVSERMSRLDSAQSVHMAAINTPLRLFRRLPDSIEYLRMTPAINRDANRLDTKGAVSVVVFKHIGFKLVDDLVKMDQNSFALRTMRLENLSLC